MKVTRGPFFNFKSFEDAVCAINNLFLDDNSEFTRSRDEYTAELEGILWARYDFKENRGEINSALLAEAASLVSSHLCGWKPLRG